MDTRSADQRRAMFRHRRCSSSSGGHSELEGQLVVWFLGSRQ